MKVFGFCYLILIFFGFASLSSYCKTPSKTNSALIADNLALRKKAKTDKEKMEVFVELAWLYRDGNAFLAKAYSDSTIELGQKLNALKYFWLGLNSKAAALSKLGNNKEAFKIYLQALELAEKNHDTKKIAHSNHNIGLVFKAQGNFKLAIEYVTKANVLFQSINDTNNIINSRSTLAGCQGLSGNMQESLKLYLETIELSKKYNNDYYLTNMYNNAGNCYYYLNQPQKAKEYYHKALMASKKYGFPNEVVDSYSNYAYMLNEEGDYKQAQEYYEKALQLAKISGYKNNLIEVYDYMAEMFVSKKDFKSAYYYADTAKKYNDSITSEANMQSLNEMSQRFDSEKKQLQIENLGRENELKENENKQQKFILLIIGLALLISISLGISVYKQYKEKNRANQIIHKQKEVLEEKQKEIVDSITYAKRLQEAILPTEHLVKDYLPNSFILYKPKDIVAGDFYWMHHSEGSKEKAAGNKEKAVNSWQKTESNEQTTALLHTDNCILIAAADCTGHGVPGALVSVVCSNALHRTVNEFGITDPGKILDKTRELVLETFARSNKDVKDGMDISLCSINLQTKQLNWSGANNPLWYIQNGELKEVTANKQPIGKTEAPQPFTTHRIQLQKGDSIYMFTDGYADQFGGPKGKKFKYKPFKELLLQNSALPPVEQQQKLEQAFSHWKGQLEQVDDICIIGVRI